MAMKRNVLKSALVAGLLCGVVGCGSSDETSTEPSGNVEIFSWWVSGGEVEALNAMISVYENKYPKAKVKNLAEDLAEQARDQLQQRMADGVPPDTFQANIGQDLMQWALFNELNDSDSKVEPLNELANKNGWLATFPAPVLDSLSYEGNVYGVPANIHRNNALFYSIPVFEAAGATPPATLDDLLAVSQQLQDAGYTPLCIGSSHWWTVVLLTFENIFPAVAGGDYYMSYWRGQEEAQSTQIHATLDYLLQLWPYFNADANSLDWTAGIDHMFDDESACAMTVMGDWAKGYLETKGWRAGTDFEQIPFPGTNGTFVFTADTFPLPKGAPNRRAALALLETIGSIEGQIAFNVVKGSIPARTDVDPAEFDATAQRTMADFESNQLINALSGIVTQPEDLGPALKDMLSRSSKEAPLNVLSNDYHTFR